MMYNKRILTRNKYMVQTKAFNTSWTPGGLFSMDLYFTFAGLILLGNHVMVNGIKSHLEIHIVY